MGTDHNIKVHIVTTTQTIDPWKVDLKLLNWTHRSVEKHTTHKIDHTIYVAIEEWNSEKMACSYECFH